MHKNRYEDWIRDRYEYKVTEKPNKEKKERYRKRDLYTESSTKRDIEPKS